MKPPPFAYVRPDSLAAAVRALEEGGEDAHVLAGGQSLVPMLNFRLARPSVLVDVMRAPELRGIRRDGSWLVVGAAVRQRVAERDRLVSDLCPVLADALRRLGHLQTRTRGTIGGSVAHADPAAEIPAVVLALDAELVCESSRGGRVIPAREFFAGPYQTALEPTEILTSIRLPVQRTGFARCRKITRRAGDFAVAGLAATIEFEPGTNRVAEARLAAFGVGSTPKRMAATEAAVAGKVLDDSIVTLASEAAAGEVDPFDDGKGDREYRRRALAMLVTRTLEEARA